MYSIFTWFFIFIFVANLPWRRRKNQHLFLRLSNKKMRERQAEEKKNGTSTAISWWRCGGQNEEKMPQATDIFITSIFLLFLFLFYYYIVWKRTETEKETENACMCITCWPKLNKYNGTSAAYSHRWDSPPKHTKLTLESHHNNTATIAARQPRGKNVIFHTFEWAEKKNTRKTVHWRIRVCWLLLMKDSFLIRLYTHFFLLLSNLPRNGIIESGEGKNVTSMGRSYVNCWTTKQFISFLIEFVFI